MTVKIKGLEKSIKKLNRLGRMTGDAHTKAMTRVGQKILQDNGEYPRETAANRPPHPFYIRGRGMQTSPTRNLGNSEDLLQRWDFKIKRFPNKISMKVINTASYAQFVVGKRQAWFMALKGWPNVYVYVRRERRELAGLYKRVYQKS